MKRDHAKRVVSMAGIFQCVTSIVPYTTLTAKSAMNIRTEIMRIHELLAIYVNLDIIANFLQVSVNLVKTVLTTNVMVQ